jgi:hypothetical protein
MERRNTFKAVVEKGKEKPEDEQAKQMKQLRAELKQVRVALSKMSGAEPLKNTGGAGAQNYAYTGFDFNQAASNRDTGRSAKYAFAQATQEAAAAGAGDIWKTKAGAETVAEQYIKPFMEKAGFKILEIVGDKMRVLTREAAAAGNNEGVWIDWVVNAGGANPALAWQEEASRANFGPVESRYTTAATATTPTDSSGTGQTQTATGGSGQTTPGGTNPDEDAQVASDFAYQRLIDPMSTLALY